jgi:hypothetical protein
LHPLANFDSLVQMKYSQPFDEDFGLNISRIILAQGACQ